MAVEIGSFPVASVSVRPCTPAVWPTTCTRSAIPGVISVVAGSAATVPPEAMMTASRLTAYSSASRTFRFLSLGLCTLTARYSSGLAGDVTSRDLADWSFSTWASCAGGTKSAPKASWAFGPLAMSVCASTVGSWFSSMTILSGPAVRFGSLAAVQYLLRTSTADTPGVYDWTVYGPLVIGCWPNVAAGALPAGTGASEVVETTHGQSP